MEKPRGVVPNKEIELASEKSKSSQETSVNVVELLNNVSDNLMALADLVDELSQLPPDKLHQLFSERESQLVTVLAGFGLTIDDLRKEHTLN